MQIDLPRYARRCVALFAITGIVACDSTPPVEPVTESAAKPTTESISPVVTAPPVVLYSVGFSTPTVNSVSLANPSFETAYSGWAYPGTPGQYVDFVNGWQSSNGSTSVDLNGFDPGYVLQNIATIPGVTYTVSFDLAGNPGAPQGTKTMTASAGATSVNYTFSTVGKSGTNMGWTPQSFTFVATTPITPLKFQSTYVGNGVHPDKAQGPAIDNVSVTWVPTPTSTTVSFGPGPFVYNGSAFTATASSSAGTPTLTYSGDCVNPGSTCTATATLAANGQYAASSASESITIVKAPSSTTVDFGAGPFTYNGSAFTATASVTPSGSATIVYTGDCTNAGSTCTATATYAGDATHEGSSASANITIDKAPTSTSVAFASSPVTYNGSAFAASASVTPSAAGAATITYSGDCTNAGSSCSATASFAGSANYLPSSSGSASLTINKAPTTTSVSFGTGPTVIYTGSAFTATASVSPTAAGSATIAYSGQCTFAGVCTANASYAGNGNYLASSASTSITIKYPVATTDGQCKNGGWQYLVDDLGNRFKNQGDCVSYVATKTRNKGAGGQ